jgi:hypothetical protein
MTKTNNANKNSKNSKAETANTLTDLSSFTGRTADGTWNELDFKAVSALSDPAFASLLSIGSSDFKLASDADKELGEKRKPYQKQMGTIQHNMAVALLKRHPVADGDWLSIPVGQSRWTLQSRFKEVGADIAAFNTAFTDAGFKENNIKKIRQRILDKARAMAFERDFDEETHSAIVACFNKLATLSTEVTGTMAETIWEKAEDVFATGAGLIPDATRAAIYADTMNRMEAKAEEKAQRETDKRAKAIAKAAKANSNTTPKVNGALVG